MNRVWGSGVHLLARMLDNPAAVGGRRCGKRPYHPSELVQLCGIPACRVHGGWICRLWVRIEDQVLDI